MAQKTSKTLASREPFLSKPKEYSIEIKNKKQNDLTGLPVLDDLLVETRTHMTYMSG